MLARALPDRGDLSYTSTWSRIACEVNSDLSVVGFLSCVSKQLASV